MQTQHRMYGTRMLLLAPHPDDEVVGCCAAIRQARARGSSVSVLFLTTGVPAPEDLWPWDRRSYPARVARRRKEALGVSARMEIEQTYFAETPSRKLKDELGAARRLAEQKAAEWCADTLWAPAYEGGHPDHDVTNFLASTLRGVLDVWEFAEYNFFGGRSRPNEFFSRGEDEQELQLSLEERRLKQDMLAAYASERGNLRHVRCEREVFRPLAGCDYSRPPHEGKLFYQRFQWVPFHPQVHHIGSEEICAAIARERAPSRR